MNIEQAKEILGNPFKFTSGIANDVIQDLGLSKDAMILDVGTGLGNMALTLALNGFAVLTGEPESDDSDFAKQNWRENAKKVGVEDLIKFKNFSGENMPFEDNIFDAVFMFGALHHVDEYCRINVLRECIRVSKMNAVICIFEPNQKALKMIKEKKPSHPDAADPLKYTKSLPLKEMQKNGEFFDAFIFHKL